MGQGQSAELPTEVSVGILRAFQEGEQAGRIADRIALLEFENSRSSTLVHLHRWRLPQRLREEGEKIRREIFETLQREDPGLTAEDIEHAFTTGAEYGSAQWCRDLLWKKHPDVAAQVDRYGAIVRTHSLQALEWWRRKRRQEREQGTAPNL